MADKQPRQKVRVLIVDDHPIVRTGLMTLLGNERGIEIVGGVDSGEEAASFLDTHRIDVVLLDLRMPKTSGLEILPRLVKRLHAPKVMILSSFEYEEEIYRAAKSGASGYLIKSSSGQQIVDAIFAVADGKEHFPEAIAARMAERENRPGLSPREQEVLLMLSKGLTNKEIAHVLQLSQFTVRNHIIHIMEKLEASSRTEALSIAVQQGLITV